MNFKICGIIDIVLIVLFVVFIVVGLKKGFVEKFLSLANSLCGFLFSIVFCRDFASFMVKHNIFYNSIYNKVYSNVSSSEALKNGDATALEVLKAIGFPENISKFIAERVNIDGTSVAVGISENVSKCLMVVIAFFVLFFGTTLICFILKIVFKALKDGSTVLKVLDGTLGVIFYGLVFFVIVDILLFGVSLLMQTSSFSAVRNFIDIDMQLSTSSFRLSKYLYNHNPLANIIGLFI